MRSPRSTVVVGVVVQVLAMASAAGCTRGTGDARELAVSSDAAARNVVDAALRDLAAGDVGAVLGHFCDQSSDGQQRTRELLAPVLRRGDLSIRRVEPAWVGAEPYFFVEVAAGDGGWQHGFGVRVRDGCVDRAVGASRPPERDAIDL
jgi:hypothetical protein